MNDWEALIDLVANRSSLLTTALLIHIKLVLLAEIGGIAVAFPLAIAITYSRGAAKVVLRIFNIINTIPSLVLLGVAMSVFGIGFLPAVLALFIYSIQPILQNAYTGLMQIEPKYLKAARGMGMNERQILFKVKIPLAFPVILSGIRISAVYIISWATLGALIGAGGLGDLLYMGTSMNKMYYVIAGTIPTCVLAIVVNIFFSCLERASKHHL